MCHTLRRSLLLLGAVVVLATASGCANYWQYRWDDLHEVADVGVTYSRTPYLVFYHSVESLFNIGYGNYECTFYGLGGGHLGRSEHYMKAWGALVWADEHVGWRGSGRDYDKDDPNTLYEQNAGFIGLPYGLISGHSNPSYVPT
jgi:hypothetical protein